MIAEIVNNEILIQETRTTPSVDFKNNGLLTIKGRSYGEDVSLLYNPLIEWVKEINAPEINFNMKMEYFNSASCKFLFRLLSEIDNKKELDKFSINWFCEYDDEDVINIGKVFEESLERATFSFFIQ